MTRHHGAGHLKHSPGNVILSYKSKVFYEDLMTHDTFFVIMCHSNLTPLHVIILWLIICPARAQCKRELSHPCLK